jgi:hypothetical protein
VVRAGLRRGAGAAHRPLPGQAGGAEPDGAALRQRAVRAAVAAREHRQHPDHAGREHRRGHARRLLRPHRRAARHGPEPRAAAADDDRDGAAVHQRRRRHPRREAQGAEVAQALHARERGARRGARPVQGRHRRRQPVPGYLDEAKVPPAAHCETFVALRTEVQNWRWAGVPFYLRTGKRLAARDAQIVVNFREVPHPIFPGTRGPTSWSSSCSPRTGWSCTCWRPRAGGASCWRR